MGDGLVGADGHAELAAVLDVRDGHLQRPVADADELGADRDEGPVDPAPATSPGMLLAGCSRARTRAVGRVGSIDAMGVTSASRGVEHGARRRRPIEHDHVGARRADDELGDTVAGAAESAGDLAGGEPGQPALALGGGCRRVR